jgi:hypothetical protein
MSTLQCVWNEERSVAETLERCAGFVASWPWVLFTSVDSHPDVASMPWASEVRKRFSDVVRDVDGALLLPGHVVVDVIGQEDFLFGFDELWFCETTPSTRPAAPDYLVAPRRLDELGSCDEFAWLEGSPFVGGIGDGLGMNFVTRDRVLLEGLELSEERDEIP